MRTTRVQSAQDGVAGNRSPRGTSEPFSNHDWFHYGEAVIARQGEVRARDLRARGRPAFSHDVAHVENRQRVNIQPREKLSVLLAERALVSNHSRRVGYPNAAKGRGMLGHRIHEGVEILSTEGARRVHMQPTDRPQRLDVHPQEALDQRSGFYGAGDGSITFPRREHAIPSKKSGEREQRGHAERKERNAWTDSREYFFQQAPSRWKYAN